MSVDSSGRCTLHLDKLDDDKADTYRHDRPAREKAVKDWNDRIDEAVKAFQDADSNLIRALKADPSDDGKGIKDGFNGALKGDAGAANADRTEKLYNRVEKGKKLSPEQTRELSFLMRENERDPEFSRTLLNSMGPDGVIKTSNALDNQAYYDDTDHKKRYLSLQKHLANSLATATTADSANQPGSASMFASQWREKLRQDCLEKYDLTLSEKTGRDPDQ